MPKSSASLRHQKIPPFVMDKVGSRLAILLASVTMPAPHFHPDTPQHYKDEYRYLQNLELIERAEKIKMAIADLRASVADAGED